MNKTSKKILSLFSRYLAIIILAISNFYIIRKILSPLTLHATNLVIKIFTSTTLTENIIRFNETAIQITTACVAPSAFYLLLSLLLSTANIKSKTMSKAILTATAALFVLNLARILILSTLITSQNFETIHWLFWHIASTVLVIATYIATIKLYKIKSVPVASDFKYLKSLKKN